MPTRSACYGLRYRFGASLRSALLTHPPHASRSSLWILYLVFRHIFALPCLSFIIKRLQGQVFCLVLNYLYFTLFYIDFQACTKLNLEYMDF
ncbi:MAG: hypothetical protein RML94_04920 [Bacteroidia bacterium]|nr:hypothetical protein [Bacteroidia bacterium]